MSSGAATGDAVSKADAETAAIMLWGIRARGRRGVHPGIRQVGASEWESGVWCEHGVSLFDRCEKCVAAAGGELVWPRPSSGLDSGGC